MLQKPFGGAFTASYYPHVNNERINPPAQTPSIYIFEHNPSDADILAGTNAIGVEITTWVETTDYVRTFTVPAVADSSVKVKRYWIGLKYLAVSGGTATYDREEFELVQPDGQLQDPTPTATEVKAYDANLTTYFTDVVIDVYASIAESKLKQTLRNKKIVWTNIENPDALKPLIIYKSLADMWSKEVVEEGDKFDVWRKEYQELYQGALDSLVLEYDANSDDDLSEEEETTPAYQGIRLTR